MYNNNFVPNYYPNLQNPYYNPPVQMPQTYSQQNNDLNNYQIPQQQNNDNDSGIEEAGRRPAPVHRGYEKRACGPCRPEGGLVRRIYRCQERGEGV